MLNLFRRLYSSITTADFWPNGHPDYVVSGRAQNSFVDGEGNTSIRGPIVTDEQGAYDDFLGNSLSADYETFVTGGGSLTVGSSLVTLSLPAGSSVGDHVIVTRNMDYLPLVYNLFLNGYTRESGVEFFYGLYHDTGGSHVVANADSYVEAIFPFDGVGVLMTNVGKSANAAGNTETVTGIVSESTTTSTWRTTILEADGATWRDLSSNISALPTTNTRNRLSRHVPDIYAPLFLAFGLRCTGAMANPQTVSIDAIKLRNINILDVNTAR